MKLGLINAKGHQDFCEVDCDSFLKQSSDIYTYSLALSPVIFF